LPKTPRRANPHAFPGRAATFARKNVHRAERQDAQPRPGESLGRVPDAVKDFIHGAIATRRHDEFKTIGHGFRRQPPRFAGGSGGLQGALRGDVIQMPAKMPGLVAAGRRVENDASAHAINDLGCARH
jgi:hypothetical protein